MTKCKKCGKPMRLLTKDKRAESTTYGCSGGCDCYQHYESYEIKSPAPATEQKELQSANC